MMIGVTSGEGFIFLNHEEMELGLETEGRNRMLSDLVTSSYKIHEKEIFSAILTGTLQTYFRGLPGRNFKGNENIISSSPSCKYDRFITVFLK